MQAQCVASKIFAQLLCPRSAHLIFDNCLFKKFANGGQYPLFRCRLRLARLDFLILRIDLGA
jgi:hypothetical protein